MVPFEKGAYTNQPLLHNLGCNIIRLNKHLYQRHLTVHQKQFVKDFILSLEGIDHSTFINRSNGQVALSTLDKLGAYNLKDMLFNDPFTNG